MLQTLKAITTWLTTSGIKILGILIGLIVLTQLSSLVETDKWQITF